MSADVAMDDIVEYLYTSDLELDEQPKCGEIFICFTSIDFSFLCVLCKNQSNKYFGFEEFANHIRGEHFLNAQNIQSPSSTTTTYEIVLDVGVSADDDIVECTDSGDFKETYEELKYSDCAAGCAEIDSVEIDHDVEMLTADEDYENEDDSEIIEHLIVKCSSYRQCMTDILDNYRKCIGIWHTKTAENTPAEVKAAAWKFLWEKYSTYYPGRSFNDLQDRLNNMTKRFNTDCQVIDNEADEGASKQWYFKHLTFLRYANDEEISEEDIQDFDCPSCEEGGAVSKSSIDLWTHITTNHLKIENEDPLTIETTKLSTLQWPEDIILKFIELYHEQECLWNVNSRTYYDRLLKANAYKMIIEKFNEITPDVLKDRRSVRDSIRHLRDYFCRLTKKYKISKSQDISKLPLNKFKIYEKLLFLKNVYMPKDNSAVQTFTCELCGEVFSKKKDLCDHRKSEHANVDDKNHHKVHVRNDGKTYSCPICHVYFHNSEGLATHLNEHLPKKSQKQVCEICGVKIDDRSNLLIHIRRHTNTKNYICSICNKGFVTSTELKSHVVVHSDDRPYVCEVCGLRFKYSNRLSNHRLFHGEPKFKCKECNMNFFTKRHLNEHHRIHAPPDAPVEKFRCDICGSLFRNSESLSRHCRKIHNIKKREQYNMVVR